MSAGKISGPTQIGAEAWVVEWWTGIMSRSQDETFTTRAQADDFVNLELGRMTREAYKRKWKRLPEGWLRVQRTERDYVEEP